MKKFENNSDNGFQAPQTSSGEESEMISGYADYHVEMQEMPDKPEDGIQSHGNGKGRHGRGLRRCAIRSRQSGQQPARKSWFKRHLGKYISPVFLLMLLLSFGMWYMIKLGSNYVTEIKMHVNIEGHGIVVSCMAEGKGTDLLFGQRGRRRPINVRWSDVEVTPSPVDEGYVTVSPHSLQNAISVRCPDLKIIHVSQIPEIKL